MHRVKIHDYLENNFDHSETGVVKFRIVKYLQKFPHKFLEELRGTSAIPAADHLFQVRGEDEVGY